MRTTRSSASPATSRCSDDRPFLHAHATFADATGACVGGHLLRGIEVFAAEVMIREISGVSLVRLPDEETGLALW